MLTTQSNTKAGSFVINAAVALTDLEGRLVKLADGGTIPEVDLPATQADLALFVVEEGGAIDTDVTVIPLEPGRNVRARANGTGSAGEVLILCDPTAAAGVNAGKVEKLPATAGSYFSPGVAEEDFVDEQLVKFRPHPRIVVVATQVTLQSTNGTAGAAADLTALKAEMEKLSDDVRAIHAALVVNGQLTA